MIQPLHIQRTEKFIPDPSRYGRKQVRSRVGKVLGNLSVWKQRYERKRNNAIAEHKYRVQMQKAAAMHTQGQDSAETLPGFAAPVVFESIKFDTSVGIPMMAIHDVELPSLPSLPKNLYSDATTETPGMGAVPMNDMPGNMGLGALANRLNLGFSGFAPSVGLPGMHPPMPLPAFTDLPGLPGMNALAGLPGMGMLPSDDPQFPPMTNEEADMLLASVTNGGVKVADAPLLTVSEPPLKKQRTG